MRLPSQSLNCEFSRGPKPEKVTSVARRIEERKSGHRHVSRMYHHVSWYPQQLYFGQGAVAHGRGRPSSHTGRELVSRPSHPCAETNSRTRGSFHKGQHPPLLTIMQHIPATGPARTGWRPAPPADLRSTEPDYSGGIEIVMWFSFRFQHTPDEGAFLVPCCVHAESRHDLF